MNVVREVSITRYYKHGFGSAGENMRHYTFGFRSPGINQPLGSKIYRGTQVAHVDQPLRGVAQGAGASEAAEVQFVEDQSGGYQPYSDGPYI